MRPLAAWLAPARAWLLRVLRRHLPILTWLPKYSVVDAVGDALAGLTVGLTLIPQAIAYAALAGLPPQYGLYSALAGGLVYAVLGTCTEISVQLTALVALLTASYTLVAGPDIAVLLCFLAGGVQLLCGILRLGFLVDFVSSPVVTGFTAAAAITIASSQLKGMLGLSYEAQGFVDTWRLLFQHLPGARLGDAMLALACIATLLGLRALKSLKIAQKLEADETEMETVKTEKGDAGEEERGAEQAVLRRMKRQRLVRGAVWLLTTGRNAIVVLAAAGLTAGLSARGMQPFVLSGSVEPGLPEVRRPPFETTYNNRTFSFVELCQELGAGIAVVPFISILGNVAIAKAFARGRVVDASQEMLALGVCNVVASFFRSAPVAGSFTCSAVSKASGVRTPLAAAYTAALVAMSLALLTQYFSFIPRAALAAVVISAVVFMADFRCLVPMWKASRWDLLPLGATFAASLALGVAPGLLVGVAADVALLLFFTARPRIDARTVALDEGGGCYVLVSPASGLAFPCVDHVRGAVVRALAQASSEAEAHEAEAKPDAESEADAAAPGPSAAGKARAGKPVAAVLDMAHAARVDFSGALGLASLAAELRSVAAEPPPAPPPPPLVLANVRPSVAVAVAAAAAPAPPPLMARDLVELQEILRGLISEDQGEVSKL